MEAPSDRPQLVINGPHRPLRRPCNSTATLPPGAVLMSAREISPIVARAATNRRLVCSTPSPEPCSRWAITPTISARPAVHRLLRAFLGTAQGPDEARRRQPRVWNGGRPRPLRILRRCRLPARPALPLRLQGLLPYDLGRLADHRPQQRMLRAGRLLRVSTMEQWLRDDLAANPAACTLALLAQACRSHRAARRR